MRNQQETRKKQGVLNQKSRGKKENRKIPSNVRSIQSSSSKRPSSKEKLYQAPVRKKKIRRKREDYQPVSSAMHKKPRAHISSSQRPDIRRGDSRPKKSSPSLPKKRWGMFFSKLGSVLFYVITIGFILGALFFAANRNSEDGSVYGYSWYNVKTNSMAPSQNSPKGGFYAGDMIVVKKTDFSEIKLGDIVTFRIDSAGKNQLTHRVVQKLSELNGTTGNYLVTQGDANDSKDAPVSEDRIVGKVQFVIPKVGIVISQAKQHWKLLVASLFGFWLIGKGVQMYSKNKNNERR